MYDIVDFPGAIFLVLAMFVPLAYQNFTVDYSALRGTHCRSRVSLPSKNSDDAGKASDTTMRSSLVEGVRPIDMEFLEETPENSSL